MMNKPFEVQLWFKKLKKKIFYNPQYIKLWNLKNGNLIN